MENKPAPRLSAPAKFVRTVLKDTAKIGAVFVVVIGASLWFFAPSCACTSREYTYTLMMKSDLRDLQSSQEIYYADHETYSASLSELLVTNIWAEGFATEAFQPSPGVTVIVDEATSDGFSAHATHAGTPVQCVVFGGNERPPDPAVQLGEVYCSEP